MFLIKYGTNAANTVFTTLKLSPHPVNVEYPDRRAINVKASKDGSVIIQRPIKDSRPRRWLWDRFRSNLPTYENQWLVLETLDAYARAAAGLNPLVYVWENESGNGGFDKLSSGTEPDGSYSNVIWTAVKFIQVSRKTVSGSAPTQYDESFIEFVIEDATYTQF